MRLLHELDPPNYESVDELSPMCPALWRCRKKITIEYLSFKFQEYSQARDKPNRCEVLAEFLKKVYKCNHTIRNMRDNILCMRTVSIQKIIISHKEYLKLACENSEFGI